MLRNWYLNEYICTGLQIAILNFHLILIHLFLDLRNRFYSVIMGVVNVMLMRKT